MTWARVARARSGLALVDDHTYVQAFQATNETVRAGWFAAFFFGPLPLLVPSAALTRGAARMLLVGSAYLYLVGVLGVTFLGNVPMNQELAGVTDLAGRRSGAGQIRLRGALETAEPLPHPGRDPGLSRLHSSRFAMAGRVRCAEPWRASSFTQR